MPRHLSSPLIVDTVPITIDTLNSPSAEGLRSLGVKHAKVSPQKIVQSPDSESWQLAIFCAASRVPVSTVTMADAHTRTS